MQSKETWIVLSKSTHKVYNLNLEPDFEFGLTPLPELWTGPSVLVQRGFSSGPEGDEPRTGPPKSDSQ